MRIRISQFESRQCRNSASVMSDTSSMASEKPRAPRPNVERVCSAAKFWHGDQLRICPISAGSFQASMLTDMTGISKVASPPNLQRYRGVAWCTRGIRGRLRSFF
jgi:hypothetical protein